MLYTGLNLHPVAFFSLSHTQNPTKENKNQTGLEHFIKKKLNQWFPPLLVCLALDTIILKH